MQLVIDDDSERRLIETVKPEGVQVVAPRRRRRQLKLDIQDKPTKASKPKNPKKKASRKRKARKDKGKRPPKRREFTPEPVIEQFMRRLSVDFIPKNILDTCAGSGAFGAVARRVWPGAFIEGVEPEPVHPTPQYDRFKVMQIECYRDHYNPIGGLVDLIITNPPFSLANWLVANMKPLLSATGQLWLLMPSDWGQRSAASRLLFETNTPFSQIRIGGTINFHGPGYGSDLRCYSWFGFGRQASHADEWPTSVFPCLPPEERKWTTIPGQVTP